MRSESCPLENAVRKARRTNDWTEDLRRHFQECSVCQESESSAEWIRNAAVPLQPTPLPDPDVIWIRSRIAAREREASRAVWRYAFRKTLLYGSLSAAGAWLVLNLLRTEGIDLQQQLPALPIVYGVVPLGAAILTAAVVYFTPFLITRLRGLNPF